MPPARPHHRITKESRHRRRREDKYSTMLTTANQQNDLPVGLWEMMGRNEECSRQDMLIVDSAEQKRPVNVFENAYRSFVCRGVKSNGVPAKSIYISGAWFDSQNRAVCPQNIDILTCCSILSSDSIICSARDSVCSTGCRTARKDQIPPCTLRCRSPYF